MERVADLEGEDGIGAHIFGSLGDLGGS